MANLRANRITGTEVFETTGSVQFFNENDKLTIGTTSQFAMGDGDFTVELWAIRNSDPKPYSRLIHFGPFWNNNDSWGIIFDDGDYPNKVSFSSYKLGNDVSSRRVCVSGLSVANNVWYHIAVTRKSNTFRLFINGNLEAISERTGTIESSSSNYVCIGSAADRNAEEQFNGHISNVRVLKGTALYTSNFTPPTRELTVIPNTVLLCCQSTTNTAQEATGKTITVNGNAVANELTPGLLTNRVKSGGSSEITGSVEFDGNDYLSLADSDDLELGNNNFTIECWVYLTQTKSSLQTIFSKPNSSTGISPVLFSISANTTTAVYYLSSNGTSWNIASSVNAGTVGLNSWSHIALVRNGNIITPYVNGIAGTSTTTSANLVDNSFPLLIGANSFVGSIVETIFGFISNLRIIKGQALYTSNFIPPTRKLTRLPGTVLLCCQDSTNPLQEATGKTITVNGNATARGFAPPIGSDGTVTFEGVTRLDSPNYFYLPTGTTEDRGRGRGVFGGGFGVTGGVNAIDYITISSAGNANDFGDLTQSRWGTGACSSHTRGIFGGGYFSPAAQLNTIDYITISSTGNASDFGDLTQIRRGLGSCSSSTRGVFGGGYTTTTNTIDYITISSTGNASDFGDLTQSRYALSSCSSSTRGVFGGGAVSPFSSVNTIDYITISSTGNASDFGDLILVRQSSGSCSSSTKGVFGGGYNTPSTNTIDYITISSTGNASDFGDLTVVRHWISACSDSHGGLG